MDEQPPEAGAEDSPRSEEGKVLRLPTKTKPVSRETTFKRLRALDCFDEIHELVVSGLGNQHVAAFIQEERGELTDLSSKSLETILDRYRASLPPMDMVADRLPPTTQKAVEKVRRRLNELEAMAELFEIQRERIGIDFKLEKDIKKLLPTMTQEVKAGLDILDKSARLKLELGLGEEVLGERVIRDVGAEMAEKVPDERVRAVLANPESRLRLTNLASKILSLADDEDKTTAVLEEPEVLDPEDPVSGQDEE